MKEILGAELARLEEDAERKKNWKRWGPYLAERQWGTVREDYSADGACWDYFTHDQARSRAYRWGEDGILGITDRQCRLCFALAMWNGRDPILKERLFGLTGPEGNHGEDVKEQYFYLDSTPTHSYLRGLYKYPQREYPYARLVEENRARGREHGELELVDTGAFDEDRYFDVYAKYAKAGPDDILITLTVHNRGPERATLHLLPTLWFRNTWVWGCRHEGCWIKPRIRAGENHTLITSHVALEAMQLSVGPGPNGAQPELLFTENETHFEKVFGTSSAGKYFKDGFHEFLIGKNRDAVNPKKFGTKAAAHYVFELEPQQQASVRLRLYPDAAPMAHPFADFDALFELRRREALEFYDHVAPAEMNAEEKNITRQGYAGLLWSKQFYHYIVQDWLDGDPEQPPPPAARKEGRNADWTHLYNRDVLSMPDKWEYPWYAAWDLAFHMIPFSRIDPSFAKEQLLLFLREWYMHPNGQIPAYEFAFSDVNPPVHAWAVWRVYKITAERGRRDRRFLAAAFQKLLLNFTWWVNRKDVGGKHIFSGGFLGLDNIGVFDRSKPLPTGGYLEQADGTAWMAFYCTTMLAIAMELAEHDPVYEDMASKFFEHFVAIADAMNTVGGTGLWDERDGFYYDKLHVPDGSDVPLRVRSMVGLIPLFAVEVLSDERINRLPGFKKRTEWFLEHRRDLARHISYLEPEDHPERGHRLLAIPSRERLERVLQYLFDEDEFLSAHGVRSMSRVHREHPFVLRNQGNEYHVEYVPGESTTNVFGGNSNWRGPIWFPVNYLLVESLERYHLFYGDRLTVELPKGSGRRITLQQAADELSRRLARLFLPDAEGRRPSLGDDPRFHADPHWRELVLFHEYFHGETGEGLGANHQTGWTALAVRFVETMAKCRRGE